MKNQTYKSEKFGQWIKQTRQERKMSQIELAERAGKNRESTYSRSFISRLETNDVGYSRDTAIDIITALVPEGARSKEAQEFIHSAMYLIGLVPEVEGRLISESLMPMLDDLDIYRLSLMEGIDNLNAKDWRDLALSLRGLVQKRIEYKLKRNPTE